MSECLSGGRIREQMNGMIIVAIRSGKIEEKDWK